MKKTTFCLIGLAVLVTNVVNGQTPRISFYQGGAISLEATDSEYYEIRIKPESFTIQFPASQLHACTGFSAEMFSSTQPNVDINKDFNSCFFIYKYVAMHGDAEYLPVGKDMAASLNESHGAKKVNEKASEFTVSDLWIDGETKPLKDFKEFFLALWLDANSDDFIDEDELLKVRVIIV